MSSYQIIRRVLYRLAPNRVKTALTMLSILDGKYGHWKSIVRGESINTRGEPIPWYTYPAIEYLDQLDFTDKVVFEWGSGNSSLYWAQAAKTVSSIEDDPRWLCKIRGSQPENLTIHLVKDEQSYVNAIARTNHKYDVIIIDGSYRYQCALVAPKFLRDGGLIILDNSDWCPESAKVLRDAGLLQVDLSGSGPIAKLTWTTTLFFHRNFSVNSKEARQPRPSLGSVPAPQNDTYQLR